MNSVQLSQLHEILLREILKRQGVLTCPKDTSFFSDFDRLAFLFHHERVRGPVSFDLGLQVRRRLSEGFELGKEAGAFGL